MEVNTPMTNLMLRNPISELQREVDRLFESFFPVQDEDVQVMWSLRVDMWESDDAYHLIFDLPGLTKQDVQINYQDGMLTISGERTRPRSENGQYRRVERPYGRFFRSISLARGVDVDGIDAHFENAVDVPKTEDVRPRRIKIS